MAEPAEQSSPIAAAVASREGRILARSILGTTDPGQIAGTLDAFCAVRLGARVEETFFCELSVGAAFGLRLLRDGRRVLLKVHPPERAPRFLEAAYRVQHHLWSRGFPCPEPITGPLPLGRGLATVETFVDDGEFADAHREEVRREMARELARMIDLASEVSDVRDLPRVWTWPENWLWPEPHNALFDFEATAAGWIDDVARRAKKTVENSHGRCVVGHADWSVKHFRFTGDEVRVIYDWDSLRFDEETIIVGTAGATFPATWHLPVRSRAPSPSEMRSFIEEYEAARGRPFSRRERETVVAAAAYVIAYSARCEHAVDTGGEDLHGSFREALSRHGEDYLRARSGLNCGS